MSDFALQRVPWNMHPIHTFDFKKSLMVGRAAFMTVVALATPHTQAADTITFHLQEATISDVQQAMEAGALSSVELTVLYLNRIQAYDHNGIRLNAIPVMNPAALIEAANADRLRAESKLAGPLLGIPYTVKDSYKVKGLTIAAGSPAFASLIANEDSFVITQLRAAGGVLIGKTNMPPMAAGGMQRGIYGRVESPYNADYLTAAWGSGSSSGSATSIAANFAMFSMGEESVSSGRSPSSNNALVAYTPSRGLISIRGNWPLYPMRDVVVPMTRGVDDLLVVLDAVVTEDPITTGDLWRDQKAVKLPTVDSVRPTSFQTLANPDALRGKRIGVPNMYIGTAQTDGGPIPVRPSIRALWDKAALDLQAQGATIVEVDFTPLLDYESDQPGAQKFVALGLIPEEWWPMTSYKPNAVASARPDFEFSKLNPYSWEDFLRSCEDPNLPSWTAVDTSLIFPIQPGSVDEKLILQGHRQSPASSYNDFVTTIKSGVQPYASLPLFNEALRGLENIRKAGFEQWMLDHDLDLLAMPANADIGRADADINAESYLHATSNGVSRSNTNRMMRHLGIPSVSVPMGIMSDTGMPVNLTFMGTAYSDNQLLSYAYAYEAATHKRKPPSRTPSLDDETIIYSSDTAIPPSKRVETTPPTITIDASTTLVSVHRQPALRFSGSVVDTNGVSDLHIYLNGHKLASHVTGESWSTEALIADINAWKRSENQSVTLLALAKDRWGNASAEVREIKLPN